MFHSEMFYDSKFASKEGCEKLAIKSSGQISGRVLRCLPVPHTGNMSASVEEAEVTARLVQDILASKPSWVDRKGNERLQTPGDIVIITSNSAQVFETQERLPDAFVGTMDKFQGQEAPIVIYSVATLSHADVPRCMEFLYSANRFHVAISRGSMHSYFGSLSGRVRSYCKTPRQIQLATVFTYRAGVARGCLF